MSKKLINVSGHDFVKLGSEIDMDSIAWNFWNFVRGTGSTEEEIADNLALVGDALKDKFGEMFSMKELEDWISSKDNKVEDILKELEIGVSESDEDEDDEDEDEDEDDDDDDDDIDGCGAPVKKK